MATKVFVVDLTFASQREGGLTTDDCERMMDELCSYGEAKALRSKKGYVRVRYSATPHNYSADHLESVASAYGFTLEYDKPRTQTRHDW